MESKTTTCSPEWAYNHARNVVKGRWPEAEATIATDPKWAYLYALNVVGGKFPAGEASIATATDFAFWYALNVVKGRFPEGEAAIAKMPQEAFMYAFKVLKGRFPLGEPVIAQVPGWALRYACDVIKDRWPEGEPAIRSSRVLTEKYTHEFQCAAENTEKVAVLITRYRDRDGEPTCALNFNTKEVCRFLGTKKMGTCDACRLTDEILDRRGKEGLGSLIPTDTCMVWDSSNIR